jgi:hypothetical protein
VSRRLPELVLLATVARAALACNNLGNLPSPGAPDAATDSHSDATATPSDAAIDRADAAPDDAFADATDAAELPDAADAADASDGALRCGPDASDPSSDPGNCGACGHDCLGGGCDGGVCQPVKIGVNIAEIQGIAVDDDSVYISQFNNGILSKVPKTGGPVQQLFKGGNPWLVAVAGPNAYASGRGAGEVLYVEKDGGLPAGVDAGLGTTASDAGWAGNVGALAIAPAGAIVYGIAADANYVYWTDLMLGNVWRAPVAGPHPSTPEIVAYSPATTGIAVSDAGVLWGGYTTNIYYLPFGASEAEAGAGTTEPLQLTRIPNIDLRFVAMDDTRAYFTMTDNGSVWTVPLAGGATTRISGEEGGPWGITADSSGVYWANSANNGNGGIRRARFENGAWSVVTVGPDPAGPLTVALDSKAIYWGDYGTGVVWKLAK